MSWQTYVDDHLMCEIEGNYLTSAAIIGQDGTVWAQSNNFPQVFFYTNVNFCLILLQFTFFLKNFKSIFGTPNVPIYVINTYFYICNTNLTLYMRCLIPQVSSFKCF